MPADGARPRKATSWFDRQSRRLPAAVVATGLALDGSTWWLMEPGSPAFDALSRRWGPLLFLAVGLLFSLLLAGLLQWQITGRRRAEARATGMSAEVQRLALVARSTSNAVVTTDLAGRMTWVNAAYERITGFSLADSLGRKPGALLQCEGTDPVTVRRIAEALAARTGFQGDILNRSKAGRMYWVHLDIQPLHDEQGALAGFIGVNTDVTERRLTEQALRVSQAFLHNTGRIAGVGGWELDLASSRLQSTEQAGQILEARPGQQLLAADCVALVAPEARQQVQQVLAGGLDAAGTGWDLELPVISFCGRRLWLRVVAEGEYGDSGLVRIVGAVQDITARRALEDERHRSEALLRGAMDSIDEAFVLFDADDRLVYCNDRYRQLHRVSAQLLVAGTPFEAILRHSAGEGLFAIPPGELEAWLALCVAGHRQASHTLTVHLSDGRVLRVLDKRMPDGHVVGFRIDITDLTRATEAAERANRAKGEFINTISHELRTPLQSVIGFSELGQTFAAGQAPFQSMFDDIHAGGQRMLTLVNALLDMSKMDGDTGKLSLHRDDLFRLAASVAHELAPLAAKRGVQIRLPEPLPVLPARVDGFRMQQVLRNVLANALRFSPEGGSVELAGIDLDDQGVVLAVRDHGPGIPPDELEAVFDAFVQSSRTRDGSGGTGLGLTISRKIMRAHGGSIVADNAPGGGARLQLWLPAAPAAGPPHAAAAAPAAPPTAAPTPLPTTAEALP